jgi:basic amino acid/polyamine antiporter, APA family
VSLMRTKSVEQSIRETDEPEYQLKKRLSAVDLTVFGVGVIIGAGIFTVTGRAALQYAGPSIIISFVVGAICCGLAALCYAEFASTVPVSGSAYTFSYASLGELVAWIIGWDLLLELMLGASVVAQGWSQYADLLLGQLGFNWPDSLASGSRFDLLAFLLVAVITVVVSLGIKESMRVNLVLVGIKVFIVLFVIIAGIGFVNTANYQPFIPPSQAAESAQGIHAPLIQVLFGIEPSTFGVLGIITGASIVFFAYIGFDVVATTAEEAKNPQRDVPIGILGSLAIVTVLYMAVSLVITGMQNYQDIDPNDAAPLATAFDAVGVEWMGNVIAVGACIGLTVVVMILMLGQTRVAFAMARDGLLPRKVAKVHPTFGTPYRITAITGVAVAIIAGLVDLATLAHLVNIGTLFAFILVSVGVVILRKTRPDLPRSFRVPAAPVVATLAVLLCLYLMLNLTGDTWVRFGVWMGLGFVVYFAYSYRNSMVGRRAGDETDVDVTSR